MHCKSFEKFGHKEYESAKNRIEMAIKNFWEKYNQAN